MATLEALQQQVIKNKILIRDLNDKVLALHDTVNNLIQKHNSLFFLVTLHGISLKEALELLAKKGVITNEELEAIKNAGTAGLKQMVDGPSEGQKTGDTGNGDNVPVQGHESAGGIVDPAGREISSGEAKNPSEGGSSADSSINT